MQSGRIKQKASPFFNMVKNWEDEEFAISEEIKKGIMIEANFPKPSHI